jgi:hypothetical protein
MKDRFILFVLIVLFLVSVAVDVVGIWFLVNTILTDPNLTVRLISFIFWTIFVVLVTLFTAWIISRWSSIR